jgi:AraC-like DNA-binding protein
VAKFITHDDKLVPMQHPSVLVEEAVAQGATRDALLVNTGITEGMLSSAEARISYMQFGALTANALTQTRNPALGLDFGLRIHLSHMGALGLLLMSSSSSGEAMQAGLRYYRTMAPAWALNLEFDGSRATLSARELISMTPFREFSTEALLAAFNALNRHLFGVTDIYEVSVHYPRPAHADAYARVFDGEMRFGQPHVQVIFDGSLLRAPLPSANKAMANWAERECAAQLSTIAGQDGLLAQARALLTKVPGQYPSQDDLARALQTSTRSMRRSFKRMGTSYTELLEEALHAHAVEYLATRRMSCESIALALGFSDARSFRRAFKRWTGKTPTDYRGEIRD